MESVDLARHLAAEQPVALLLSCAMPVLLRGARAAVHAAHASRVPVLAGGRGFGPDGIWAHAIGADAWVASPREVVEVLATWEPDPDSAEQQVPAASPELHAIEQRREALLAAAIDRLGHPPRRMRSELNMLLAAAEAALLVADRGLLASFTAWQASILASHGFAADVPAGLRQALAEALRDEAPHTAGMLAP
jgi:hypothetical protein